MEDRLAGGLPAATLGACLFPISGWLQNPSFDLLTGFIIRELEEIEPPGFPMGFFIPKMVNSAVSTGACPMNQTLGGVSLMQAVPDVTGASLQLCKVRMLELTLSLTLGTSWTRFSRVSLFLWSPSLGWSLVTTPICTAWWPSSLSFLLLIIMLSVERVRNVDSILKMEDLSLREVHGCVRIRVQYSLCQVPLWLSSPSSSTAFLPGCKPFLPRWVLFCLRSTTSFPSSLKLLPSSLV